MRSQLIAVLSAAFVLLACVAAAPTPQHDSDDCVGIATIYVTLPPPAEAFDTSMEATSIVDFPVLTPTSKALPLASLEPSAVVTSATDITKTVEETIFITHTLTQPTETGTETEAIDFSSNLVTSSKGAYSSVPENDQTNNFKTFDNLGPSVLTLPGTTISYMVDTYSPAITSFTKAPGASASDSPDSFTEGVVTIYETIPVIPIPFGYKGPIPTRVETSSASEIAIDNETLSTSQIFTTSEALLTSISAIVSSATSSSAVGSTVLPTPDSHSPIGGYGWNSTSCTDHKTNSVSDTVSSHIIALPSFTLINSPVSSFIASSLVESSNSTSFNYVIATGYESSISGMTDFNATTSSTSTASFNSAYPNFPTGTPLTNTYSAISLSLSSSISTFTHAFTIPGSIINDSGLTTSAAPLTSSSSGGTLKSTNYDSRLAITFSAINTTVVGATYTVPSMSASRSTIDDSGLATTSSVATSGSTINENGLGTSSTKATSTTTSPLSNNAASSVTVLSVASDSSASTFMTSTIDSFSSNRPAPNSTKATSTISSSASPVSCGELGDFTLDFDDLPPLAAPSDTADPMPIFSPYHQFYFDAGFVVVPPPTDPYLPASGKLLLEYIPMEGRENFGELSNDYTELTGCFNFNARGASLGCDSRGPDCDWSVTGLRYNFTTMVEDQVAAQILSTPACPALKNCMLIPISFDDTFENLTSLLIKGTVAGVEEIWWMDSVDLSWFENSCTKGRCRAGFHGMGQK